MHTIFGHSYDDNSCSLIHDTAVHVWDERRPYVPTDSFYHHRDVVTGLAWSPMSSCFLFATSKVRELSLTMQPDSFTQDGMLSRLSFKNAVHPEVEVDRRSAGVAWSPRGDVVVFKLVKGANVYGFETAMMMQDAMDKYKSPVKAKSVAFSIPKRADVAPSPPQLPDLTRESQLALARPTNIRCSKYKNPRLKFILVSGDDLFRSQALSFRFYGLPIPQLCALNASVAENFSNFQTAQV